MADKKPNNKKYKDSSLYSIYGARESKDASRINITLITGKGDNKQYATISLKKNSNKIVIKKGVVWVKVHFLKEREDASQVDTNDNDLPF